MTVTTNASNSNTTNSIADLGYLAQLQNDLSTYKKKVDRGKFWGKAAIMLGFAGLFLPLLWAPAFLALLLASFSSFY